MKLGMNSWGIGDVARTRFGGPGVGEQAVHLGYALRLSARQRIGGSVRVRSNNSPGLALDPYLRGLPAAEHSRICSEADVMHECVGGTQC